MPAPRFFREGGRFFSVQASAVDQPSLVSYTNTFGEAQARATQWVARILTVLLGMIPGGQDKLEEEFLGRRLRGSRAQLRIDGSQSGVQVRRRGHRHRITALVIDRRIAHH